MKTAIQRIAAAVKYRRLQRNIQQQTAAAETAISLRTIQNIEAGSTVSVISLIAYLTYLDLLDDMLATLPDPDKLTPLEQLATRPKRRKRARKSGKAEGDADREAHRKDSPGTTADKNTEAGKPPFRWDDET